MVFCYLPTHNVCLTFPRRRLIWLQNNGMPSSAKCQSWSRIKDVSFCFEKNFALQKSNQQLFNLDQYCHLAVMAPHLATWINLAFLQIKSNQSYFILAFCEVPFLKTSAAYSCCQITHLHTYRFGVTLRFNLRPFAWFWNKSCGVPKEHQGWIFKNLLMAWSSCQLGF